MGKLATIRDGLVNLVANLGTPRDKAAASLYLLPLMDDHQLANAYRGAWLPRKIVDIPALDAHRNWRTWNAEQDEISAIEAEEKRLGLQGKSLEASFKARLFGGAALYIGTGDANPSLPLDPTRIGKDGIRHLNVLTRRVLKAGELERDPESPNYGKPSVYTLSTAAGGQVNIHPSRLVIYHGAPKPDPELDVGDGWGDSVLLAVMDAVKNADSTAANIASLVFEAKVDVINIPNLMNSLSEPAYEAELLKRLQLAAMAKGINGMLVLDGEETYSNKQTNFAGLTDVMMSFMQLVSGAADIPVTRLLGQSPSGLNSTGEGDIRNYYDRIRSGQELVLTPALSVLDECLIRSSLGTRPAELFYSWRSLWQSTDKERADIGKTTADTIKTIADTRLLPDDVLSKVAVNMLTEAGVAPGLESEMADYVPTDEGEVDPDADDVAAAMLTTDAMPRPLYVHRKVTNAADIIAWAKEQGFETTLPAEDLHVTIAFSRDPVDWMKAGSDWASGENGGMTIKPGGARLIEKFGEGAVVLLFNSLELSWRHEAIKGAGASWDWPEYQPHITFTYASGEVDLEAVEPYRGAIVLGPEIFEPLDTDRKSKVREE
ncbi:hypothetical protein ARC20_03210 [Stenotrophomonas panacihumi]|uniref:Anti-CBASS protein Acb1 n=1 Tax=Stenotrophomonas panacihumi TaxID=676599 RepID=A0A0R0ARR2_9GAMM|nr:anti-CBASS Acb1 family protein [Stenotrophomonas panacihumi]KRG47353.1 hypothetical protein ARC20_03210 [Stenotrophomonas panacihumi]PTN55830.1 DUF1073 domain-containing protein [Stenotrophomonas panacihumi]